MDGKLQAKRDKIMSIAELANHKLARVLYQTLSRREDYHLIEDSGQNLAVRHFTSEEEKKLGFGAQDFLQQKRTLLFQ